VIGEDMSHVPKKIMPSGTQGMTHSGQLKIMSGVVLFMRSQLIWGVHNHATFLHEDTAKSNVRCITVNIERLYEVRLCQHMRCSQQLLQGSKRFITLSIPDKFLLFLQKISDGFGNFEKVRNKSAIVASQAEKNVNLMHST
jgi:exonuclease III